MVVKYGTGKMLADTCNSKVWYTKVYKVILCHFWILFFPFFLQAKKIDVGPGFQYKKIKLALAASTSGDTVIVHAGVYSEGEIVITKRVTLLGVGMPVLDGLLKDGVIIIRASGTVVSGFDIRNSGFSDIKEIAGIRIDESIACVVENNYFYNNYFAIYLANSNYCRIQNNRIEGFARTETSSGNGIHLWKGEYNTILENHISGHRDGIYFEFVKFSSIIGNLSEKNLALRTAFYVF